jgi:release factor glutamine methyltransferase
MASGPPLPLFLDLGTGSGIIAVTLAMELPWMRGLALDLKHSALLQARENARRLGAERLDFIQADWHSAFIGARRFSLVTANPPYVAAEVVEQLQPELRHEPLCALDGGQDGIAEIKRLTKGLPEIISPGGWFFMEIGYDQEDYVLGLFKSSQYEQVMVHRDYAGLPRVLQARIR